MRIPHQCIISLYNVNVKCQMLLQASTSVSLSLRLSFVACTCSAPVQKAGSAKELILLPPQDLVYEYSKLLASEMG